MPGTLASHIHINIFVCAASSFLDDPLLIKFSGIYIYTDRTYSPMDM